MSKKIVPKDKILKAVWAAKQMLPLTYVSEYSTNGQKYISVFKMWFGKCFSVRTWAIM